MKISRILLVIPQNTSGGAERVMIQLANNLAEKGIDVCLANFDSNTNFYQVSDRVNWVKMGLEFKAEKRWQKVIEAPIKEARRFLFIRKLIKQYQPDVVLPFLEMAELLTIPNCILMKTPFCVSLRNDYNAYFKYMKILSKMTYQKAKVVVCQTDSAQNSLLNSVKCKTTVIENPLDPETFNDFPYKGPRRKVVFNVGRLVPQKNQRLLINAFAQLPEEFSDYQLHIYGTGELKEELQKLIDALGMSERIILKGVMKNTIKVNFDASLFVMSSDYEGFPNTLVEAMANGVPVVSTDFSTGAARKLLADGELGKLVPVGDEGALTKAIVEMLSDTKAAEEMAIKGLYVKEQLDSKKISDQWLYKIENALDGIYDE